MNSIPSRHYGTYSPSILLEAQRSELEDATGKMRKEYRYRHGALIELAHSVADIIEDLERAAIPTNHPQGLVVLHDFQLSAHGALRVLIHRLREIAGGM